MIDRSDRTKLHNLLLSLPHLALCVVICSALAMAERQRKLFQRLLQEDGFAEWSTVVAFVIACALGVAAARKQTRPPLERAALLAISAFCLFVAGEELSWGQRLFGYRPPDFFLEKNFQQEANLHNLLKEVLDTRFMVTAIALVYGVLAPFLCFVARLPRWLSPSLSLIPYFALVAWLELSYPYELVGELAELLLGLAFLIDLAQRSGSDPLVGARRAALGQVAALAAGMLLVPLNDAVMQLHATQLAEAARAELQHMATSMRDGTGVRAALFRKQHIHKRLFTAARAGYVELPPEEYALDPWHNPYWIAFHKRDDGTGRLLLYSFGANHRRETDVDNFAEPSFAIGGDDLAVSLDLQASAHAAR